MTYRSKILATAMTVAAGVSFGVIEPVAAQQLAVEEIVVTARKREENLQEIPLSISAFTVDQLRDRGIDNIHELAELTPGFAMDRGFGRFFDRPVVRGQSSILGGRNASFFVDGVYVNNTIASGTIDSLERIEVLRGPQSALFGRATFAGAINYITKRPSDEHEGEFNGRLGSHDDYKASLWLSGPVVEDKMYYFIAGNWDYYGGEWKNNLAPNPPTVPLFPRGPNRITGPTRGDTSKLGTEEGQDLTLKFLFTPSDTVEFVVKGTYQDIDDSHYPRTLVGKDEHNCFAPVAGTATQNSPGYICGEIEARDPNTGKQRRAELNIPDLEDGVTSLFVGPVSGAIGGPGLHRESYRALAEMTLDVDDWEIVTRGSYNRDDETQSFDGDTIHDRAISGLGILQTDSDLNFEDYSFEARVSSPADEDLRGLAGVYYYNEKNKDRARSIGAFGPGSFQADGSDFDTDTVDNWAVFGALDYDVTDEVTVSIDGRYAEDKIGTIGRGGLNASSKFNSFTPRVTVDYQYTDDNMVYAKVAKGNKPGGFNTVFFGQDISEQSRAEGIAAGLDKVNEEKAWTYEVGTKNTFLDGRATFNVSAYYIDWTNQQLTQTIDIIDDNGAASTAPVLVNLGATEIFGGEVEATWVATDNITFNVGYALADTEIKVFNDENHTALTGEDDPDLVNGGNVSGNQLPKQPKHTVNFSGTYRDELSGDADWFFRYDMIYESKRWTETSNFSHTGDIWRLNLRLGVEADNWKITGYVNNALNDLTMNNVLRFRDYRPEGGEFTPFGQRWRGFFLNQPRGRDFGVDVQYSF